jgi:rare lipoprotein A
MDSNELLALSPGALEQLGAGAGAAIRVRRVNPPEDQRALLRAGGPAELRMDTPMSLVEILRRKLPGQGTAPVRTAAVELTAPPVASPPVAGAASASPTTTARAGTPPALPPLDPRRAETSSPAPATVVRAAPAPATTRSGAFVVQAAAFSTAERARRAADTLDGEVTPSGRFFRVRTGPFATRGEAEASLAKVRAAGYSDARILTNG